MATPVKQAFYKTDAAHGNTYIVNPEMAEGSYGLGSIYNPVSEEEYRKATGDTKVYNPQFETRDDGVLSPIGTQEKMNQQQADLSAGKIVNIGTAEAPAYAPANSPAAAKKAGVNEADYLASQQGKDYLAQNKDVNAVLPEQPEQQADFKVAGSGSASKFTPLRPADLLKGTNLKESDLARTTGVNIYKRDLNAEQGAIDDYIKMTGKMPKSNEDWLNFHDFVYEGKTPQGEGQDAPQGQTEGKNGVSGETDYSGVADMMNKAQSVLNKYGITAPDKDKSPVVAFSDTYKQIYDSLGLGTVKESIEKINKEIQDIDNEMNDKIVEVGDNPWLSEALRSRKIKAIQDKYSGRKDSLVNRLKLDQSLLESGREEAKFVAQQGVQISHWEDEQDQALMLKAIDWAEKEEEAKRKLAESADDDIVTSFETAGGQNMMITYNKKTGEVIEKKSIGGAYKDTNNNNNTDGSDDAITSWAKKIISGEAKITNVPQKQKDAVNLKVDEIRRNQAIEARPKTAEAVQKIITDAIADGATELEIINGLVEDFGFNKDVAVRLVNINK